MKTKSKKAALRRGYERMAKQMAQIMRDHRDRRAPAAVGITKPKAAK